MSFTHSDDHVHIVKACHVVLAVQVQQEYHALFEVPAADSDAVMRWRNRALRFVLTPHPDAPEVTDRHAGPKHREGQGAKPCSVCCSA